MKNISSMSALAASLALMGALAGCAGTPTEKMQEQEQGATAADSEIRDMLPEDIRKDGVLTVGTPFGNPPAIFVDEAGEPTGIAHDLGQEIGALMGVDVEWRELQFSGVISGLQSGNFDISMGVIGDTPERQEILDFVDLMVNESVLLVVNGNPAGITELRDACGESIGVLAGSLQIERLAEASEDCSAAGESPIDVLEYASASDAQAQVQAGRVAAYFAPYLTLNHTANVAGGGNVFELADGSYPDNPWAIGMQKDRGELADALQRALLRLVENGTYAEILSKYDSPHAALAEEQVLINGAGSDAFTQ